MFLSMLFFVFLLCVCVRVCVFFFCSFFFDSQYIIFLRDYNVQWVVVPEKTQTRGVENMEFPGLLKKSIWKFHGSIIKSDVEFPGMFKKNSWNFWHYCTFRNPVFVLLIILEPNFMSR